jgi:hypothetical protein
MRNPRNFASTILLFLLLAANVSAAPSEKPLAEKGTLVFADDFGRAQLGAAWTVAVPTFGIDEGALLGSRAVARHGAVAEAVMPLPDGNLIFECRIQLQEKAVIAFGFDDKTCQEVHSGHICRLMLSARGLTLYDDREGPSRNDITALRMSGDAAKKAEADRLSAPHIASFPVQFETARWYRLGVEIVGDQMRVTLDERPVGYLQSSGLAHPKKGDLRLHVDNGHARFDDVRMWSVNPDRNR